MKLFVVKPFIVKPLVDGQVPPHWQLFVVGWVLLLAGVGSLVMGLITVTYNGANGPLFGIFSALASCIGGAFVTIGRFARDARNRQNEVTKRLTEQDERIHELEAQIAALTSPSPKP